jgi:hypothetical protein
MAGVARTQWVRGSGEALLPSACNTPTITTCSHTAYTTVPCAIAVIVAQTQPFHSTQLTYLSVKSSQTKELKYK